MDAFSPLVLPGEFQPDLSYLVKGSTLIAWRKALQADRAVAGPGLREETTAKGRIFTALADVGLGADINITIRGSSTLEPRVNGYLAEAVIFYIRGGIILGLESPSGDPPIGLIEVSFTPPT